LLGLRDGSAAEHETPEGIEALENNKLAPRPSASEFSQWSDIPDAGDGAPSEDQSPPLSDAAVQQEADAPTEPNADQSSAAQRIAAEASATAEALDNLKRLLAHKMPEINQEGGLQRPPLLTGPAPPALRTIDPVLVDSDEHTTPAPQTQGGAIDLPRLETIAYSREGGFEFRGFLAGFALSWALGAALYVYLIFS
jgi:hypothetical protein